MFPLHPANTSEVLFLPLFKKSLNVKGRHSAGKHTSLKNIWGKLSFYGAGLSYYGKAAPLDAEIREIKLLFKTTAGLLLLQALAHTAALWPAVWGKSWSVYFQNQKLRSSHSGLEKPPPAQGAQQEGYNPYWSELHRRQHTPPGITGVQRWDSLKFIFVSLLEMLMGIGNVESRWTLMHSG